MNDYMGLEISGLGNCPEKKKQYIWTIMCDKIYFGGKSFVKKINK